MALLGKILTALAAIIPAVLDWWAKRQAAQAKAAKAADAAADADAVRDDNKSAWLRDFAGADKQPEQPPDSDNQTGA